ncbi:MAG: hypothetical protein H7322_12805 [Ramlibacter sp.]|nr:hypothetical protein [Ramlibacter sp.]
MSRPVLVFDIESIPDIGGPRAAPPESSDAEVYAAWLQERKDRDQSDFTPLRRQRVLAISCVFRNAEGIRVHSFVDRDDASEVAGLTEAEYEQEIAMVKETLAGLARAEPHWDEYLKALG